MFATWKQSVNCNDRFINANWNFHSENDDKVLIPQALVWRCMLFISRLIYWYIGNHARTYNSPVKISCSFACFRSSSSCNRRDTKNMCLRIFHGSQYFCKVIVDKNIVCLFVFRKISFNVYVYCMFVTGSCVTWPAKFPYRDFCYSLWCPNRRCYWMRCHVAA